MDINEILDAPIQEIENLVSETIETEICILGAGSAGCVAALAAAEGGADVVVLQDKDGIVTQGAGTSAYGSKRQIDSGISCTFGDDLRRIKTLQEAGETNGVLLNQWLQKSGPVFDWIISHIEPHGLTFEFDQIENWDSADEWLITFPISGKYCGEAGFGAAAAAKILAEQASKLGANFRFGVKACRLERDTAGRVVAAYAIKEDGSLLKVHASKGVIICTGGYEGNPELRDKWLPHGKKFPARTKNQGEGILMGVSIGAAVDQPPHSSNIHYNSGPNEPFGAGLPWLRVDSTGKRYCNEDAPYGNLPLQDALVENAQCYQIVDADMGTYYEKVTENGQGVFRTFPDPFEKAESMRSSLGPEASQWHPMRVLYEASAANGYAYKADTLEELAEKTGFDSGVFVETVNRMNELYDNGKDPDFGKTPARLHPVRNPPFFAIPRKATVLATLNGLVINENMQVLDTEGRVIEGLYAAGNASGGKIFGGLVQSIAGPSMTISRAQVWGYLAAQHALGNS